MTKNKIVSVIWFCASCGKDIEETKELAVADCPEQIYAKYPLPCENCVPKFFIEGEEEFTTKVVTNKKVLTSHEEL